MTIAAGDLQLSFGEESTFNTTVAPTRAIEVTDEDLKTTIDRVESKGLRTARVLASKTNWNAGNIDVGGDIGFEVQSRGMGLLFRAHAWCGVRIPDDPVGWHEREEAVVCDERNRDD
jgi:hypothetical protein